MADSKLKLSIVTALDNAGIKATEQQIEGLTKSLESNSRKVGSNMKGTFDEVNGSINGMFNGVKTFMKDIAIAIGLTKAAGTAAVKMFEKVEIQGKTTAETIEDAFHSAADSTSKFLFGTSVGDQYKKVTEEAIKAANTQIAGIETINAKLEKQKNKIDDVTQRYIKQRQSVNALNKSLDESDDILYDREQLWMVEQIRATEGEEAARQAQEALQVIGTQLKFNRNMAAFDDETEKYVANLEATKQKIESVDRAMVKAKAQLEAQKSLYDKVDEDVANFQNVNPLANDSGWQGYLYRAGRQFFNTLIGGHAGDWIYDKIENRNTEDMADEMRASRGKAVTSAQQMISKLQEQQQRLLEQQQLDENALQKREMDRANLVSRYQHEIDKMEFAREQARDNDSQVFYDINQESIDKLYDFSVESAKYQKETADNTQDLADKLDMLLQMKQ